LLFLLVESVRENRDLMQSEEEMKREEIKRERSKEEKRRRKDSTIVNCQVNKGSITND